MCIKMFDFVKKVLFFNFFINIFKVKVFIKRKSD